MGQLDLKFKYEDSGNCRVMYTAPGKNPRHKLVYCLQKTYGKEYALYRCSRDGEPSYEIPLSNIKTIEMPPVDGRTGQEVVEFLATVEY